MMFTFKAVITCVFLTVFCSLINPETEALLFSPSVGQQPLQKENLLQFLHSYFDNTNLDKYPTKMGSHRRDNPEPWSSNTYLNPESTILVLGEKIKLSHGPRKKRSQDYFLRHFYRKNDFRSEPQLEKLNNFVAEETSEDEETVYLDPLFKIPVVNFQKEKNKTKASVVRANIYRPTINVVKFQRRCDTQSVDCFNDANHRTLNNFERFLAVKPFVQTRFVLIQNLTSKLPTSSMLIFLMA